MDYTPPDFQITYLLNWMSEIFFVELQNIMFIVPMYIESKQLVVKGNDPHQDGPKLTHLP
jgi:hypothetical protein